jgi:hypothetical protein
MPVEEIKMPGPVKWLAAFGLITAVYPLFRDLPWQQTLGPPSAYSTWILIFSWIELPLNLWLLAASIGVLLRGKSWGRIWMLRWALVVSIYETAQLLIMDQWVVPAARVSDIPDPSGVESQLSELDPNIAKDGAETDYAVYWVSMLSLSTYAWWVLRRPQIRAFYESADGTTPSRLSEDAPFVPPT